MRNSLSIVAAGLLLLLHSAYSVRHAPAADAGNYFKIQAIDADTGRGVPLVKFTIGSEYLVSSGIVHVTDSAGTIAFLEPGLLGREVYFKVSGDGYDAAMNDIGERGVRLKVERGKSAVVKVKRSLAAQRLYRITGLAPYRDTLLLGEKPPFEAPPLKAAVIGQDSVFTQVYRGKLFWLWGDTMIPSDLNHCNWEVTAATSKLPDRGGLDPNVGIDLDYFTDAQGVCRRMIAAEDGGTMTWLDGLANIKDDAGRERLFAHYVQMRRVPLPEDRPDSVERHPVGNFWSNDKLADAVALARLAELGPQAVRNYQETVLPVRNRYTKVTRGLLEFDDQRQQFKKIAEFPFREIDELHIGAHPFRVETGGRRWIYLPGLFPNRRVPETAQAYRDISQYESFTCLKEGSRFDKSAAQLDRASDGSLNYAWKRNTSPIGPAEQQALVEGGHIRPDERWIVFRDPRAGREIRTHHNTVHWNAHRRRWIGIFCELGSNAGEQSLGETWYGEADTPMGPWAWIEKIVTFDEYDFYNPCQHPEFDSDGGRVIYFEGTYTRILRPQTPSTPRYEYNQLMYKLDLDDPRVFVPVAVYHVGDERLGYATSGDIGNLSRRRRQAAFFAPDRPREGTVPIYESRAQGHWTLTTRPPAGADAKNARTAFYAEPAAGGDPSPATTPLFEFTHREQGRHRYSTKESLDDPMWRRTEQPVCRVWPNPSTVRVPE